MSMRESHKELVCTIDRNLPRVRYLQRWVSAGSRVESTPSVSQRWVRRLGTSGPSESLKMRNSSVSVSGESEEAAIGMTLCVG